MGLIMGLVMGLMMGLILAPGEPRLESGGGLLSP